MYIHTAAVSIIYTSFIHAQINYYSYIYMNKYLKLANC